MNVQVSRILGIGWTWVFGLFTFSERFSCWCVRYAKFRLPGYFAVGFGSKDEGQEVHVADGSGAGESLGFSSGVKIDIVGLKFVHLLQGNIRPFVMPLGSLNL